MYVWRKRTETVDASVHGSKEGVIPMHDEVLEKQTFAVSRYFVITNGGNTQRTHNIINSYV